LYKGLAIFSKWHPTHIDYMPFTVNGSPFRPWHGDWFTGKGKQINSQEMNFGIKINFLI